MRCKYCGKVITVGADMKRGKLCGECYHRLPNVIKDHLADYTIQDLRSLLDMTTLEKEKWFLRLGNLYITEHTIGVGDFRLEVKNVESFTLEFHKREPTTKEHVYGNLSVKIITRSPRLMIEEYILDKERCFEFDYRMNEQNEPVVVFPHGIAMILNLANDALRTNAQDFVEVHKQYNAVMSIEEACKKMYRDEIRKELIEKQEKEEVRRKEEQLRQEEIRRQKEIWYQTQLRQQNQLVFEYANYFYKMSLPFSVNDLKQRRRILMRTYHPDKGGSNELAMRINMDFDVLKRYATQNV